MHTDCGQDAALTEFAVGRLVIRWAAGSYTATSDTGAVIIGREAPAHVRIDDPRISRTHVRVEPRAGGWLALAFSPDGVFVDGERRTFVPIYDGLTMRLGDARGIPVTFDLGEGAGAADEDTTVSAQTPGEDGTFPGTGLTDPAVARAGAAVEARRRELRIAQRTLARDGIMNAGALISFEKGRSWPRRQTLAKLEQVLRWPPGSITSIRDGGPTPGADEDATAVPSRPAEAPLMTKAVEIALHTLTVAIDALPAPTEPVFGSRAAAVLTDLRNLEELAADAIRTARGTPELALVLSSVRKRYDQLMLRAATAPGATLGQRLYAARRGANLTVEEAAGAAGVPPDIIARAEAEGPVAEEAATAIEALIAVLAGEGG